MKAFQIAWKDTLTRFRDWKALAGMLAAPLALSALIGLAFGNLNSAEAPLQDVPVAIVNEDDGQLGQVYIDVLDGDDLNDLIDLQIMDDLNEAKRRVEIGELRAFIYIPAGFTDSLLPSTDGLPELGRATLELFTDPAADVSPLIIQSIVERITAGLNTVLIASDVSARNVAEYAQLLGTKMADLGNALTQETSAENYNFAEPRLSLQRVETGDANETFDPFAFFIPGMAVFFLMFSMTDGSRSILLENTRGTLSRLMSTPTPTREIILGKMGGTFLTGVLQFIILVLTSSVIFQVNWGQSITGLATIVLLTVFAASGLGSVITTFARTENQAGIIGGAVSLIFGALGGSFFPASSLSGIVDIASKLTVNRWAMDGFNKLALPGTQFQDILLEAGVLALIGLVTFVFAVLGFQRHFVK